MKLTAFPNVNVKPIGTYAYFRKCFQDHVRNPDGAVVLYRPEVSVETTNWCELIGVGPDCEFLKTEHIGKFCLLPELVSGMHRLGSMAKEVNGEIVQNEDFAILESALMDHCPAVFEGK